MSSPVADVVLAPLDAARRVALRGLGKVGGRLARERALRLSLLSAWVVLSALALSLTVPLVLLALGPVLLGVPHVLADVRYLVARPGLSRRWALVSMVGASTLGAALTGHALFAGLALAGAGLGARASWPRRLVAVGLGASLALAGSRFVWQADLALAHAHNLVAVLAFALYPRRPGVGARAPLVLLAGFAGASLVVAIWPTLPGFPGLATGHVSSGSLPSLAEHAASLAPGLSPELGARVVVLFALAQAVHYGVWLRLVPEQARERAAPRTFVGSYRALRDDVGAPVLFVALVLSALVAAWALIDLRAARDGYLRAASFHGALELGALGVLVLERERGRSLAPRCEVS